MIEIAKKHANAPIPGSEEPKPANENSDPTTTEAFVPEPIVEESTGEAVSTDPKDKTAETGTGTETEEKEDESDDPAIVEMRRERAKRILKALGAR